MNNLCLTLISPFHEICDSPEWKSDPICIDTHFICRSGSRMADEDPTGTDWTAREIDLIVADYFDMLRLEIAGLPFNKVARNRALQELTRRSKGSIEFKHQNISAILSKLGYPWVIGYKPMFNFQSALLDGIERYLSASQPILDRGLPTNSLVPGVAESSAIFFESAPMVDADVASEPIAMRRLIQKFDPAARDARNRELGKQGEARVFHHERDALTSAGQRDLARKVRWVAEEDGDGAGYDILSFTPDGREKLLEVKTTVGQRLTPFFLTRNEKLVAEERPDHYRIVRLYDFARAARAFELVPPLEKCILLSSQVYRATILGA